MMKMDDITYLRKNFDQEHRYEYEGSPVPRTTEILSKTIHDDRIVYWANSLGFKGKGYRRTLREYSDYGTRIHSDIENYIREKIVPSIPSASFDAFMNWWGRIIQNPVEIVGQEVKLSCPWFGGTYDLLIKINRKLYLVDFKTSNHLTFKYCLQLAAYNFMMKYNHMESIDGFIILQLSKVDDSFNEMLLNLSNPEHQQFMELCENTFLTLVRSYYYVTEVENRYKVIGDGE